MRIGVRTRNVSKGNEDIMEMYILYTCIYTEFSFEERNNFDNITRFV